MRTGPKRTTTKAERRAAKAALAGARRAARYMRERHPHVALPKLAGVAALARTMRPRPPVPSWVWMRGNVTHTENGDGSVSIDFIADPNGAHTIQIGPPGPQRAETWKDDPWGAYDRSETGRRTLTRSYEVVMTMDLTDVDTEALGLMFNLPEPEGNTSE